ncbi:hypothetical protein [Streptomyces sp. SAJ15]|uniref:hypothetical protein n=1 Tax=Streptomyces sp. SAJ15 TaxID=2011095 RepID=UPI001187219A|nr:hypothetical protein [Streptomyces sp. SAJ15]TVL87829.1 hypothetical protein CD790_32625 [Streptomyces sp. SAJ15]
MAVVATALADDGEAAVTLLAPLEARDVCRVAVRLAAMAADTLLAVAEAEGGGRAEALARWQACILAHEAQRAAREAGPGPDGC